MSRRDPQVQFDNCDYTVGWICAITTEHVAARAFFDEEHESPQSVSPHDDNNYILGRIGKHNIVLASLPHGEYGLSSAASVARDMLHSFPNIRIGLMVGIGGGAPSKNHDIRLGDVVVSDPRNGEGGVFQYDFGKTVQEQSFYPTGHLNQPPPILRSAVSGLESQYEIKGHFIRENITAILDKNPRLRKKYKRPDSPGADKLYQSHIIHPNAETSCNISCGNSPSALIVRPERNSSEDDPVIHYGLIASANQLMKDAVVRDTLGMKKNVLCFEMEAAGLMNHFPCLVIRGICDYADTHKNKEWQGYAAMTAAAYAKDLLCLIHPNRVEALKKMDVLSDISEGLAGIVLKQNSEYRNDVLKWLTPTDYASQQHDHFSSWQPGTGEWFLNSKEYQNWLDTAAEVLLCEGIPGAGKTILTSIVIDQLTTRFHHDRETLNTGIAYIYLSYRQNYEKAENLLLSVLRQLAQIRLSLPNCITALYEQHKDKGTRPSLEAVSSALQSVISTYSRTLIVIDALDECADTNGCRSKFLAEILSLRMKSAVNIFATTRHNTEIAKQFEGSTFLEISARGEDVRRYLDDHMKRLPSFVCADAELKSEVQGTIIDSVQGMFLLAKLYLDSLAHKYTEKAVRDTLSKLSIGSEKYEHAYKDAMERIEIQPLAKKELARRVLSWIIFAKRQLSPTELVNALAVEYGHVELDNRNFINVDDVVLACESLVTVDKETEVIRLVHYTAQDYFEQTRMKWFPTAEVEITRTCATYLSFRNFDSGLCANDTVFEKRLSENPFYDYAAHFWGHHARNVSPPPQEVTAFLVCTKKVQASSQALMAVKPTWRNSEYSQNVPKNITGLHLAAYFGIEKVVENPLGEQGSDPDLSDDFGRTPISYAAGNGYETVAKQLLDTLAINSDSKDNDGQTPLMWAAKEGHSTVVEFLLVTGRGDSSARDRYSQTSLLLAAKNGHKAVTKLLIENNANLNARDNFGQTPLWWAVRNGDIPIMELLLAKKGIDINTKNHYDQSPLWWAARNGDGAAVNLLLTQDGIDVNTKNKIGQTPLGAAAQKGYEAVVSMLLAKKDIEVSIADEHGCTPLLWAARRGHVAVVKLLYNKVGAGINVMDKTGTTPLLSAAENGHTDAVRLLLTAIDVNVNVQDRNDQSALLHSAICGHDAIAKELLTIEGIEINVEDAYHQTPLLYAVKKEHEGIVKMLLDKEGIDVNAVDRHGQTPLWWAASKGNKILFQLIHTQNDVDINAKNTSGQTPLLWAARNGNEATVEFLLNVPGIDVNTKDRENLTPLWWAVKKVYKEVARLLLATDNIEVNSRDKDGQTPLLYATKQGHKKMVELLLNKANIDVNSTDKNGHTSLALALRYSQGDASLVDSEETDSGKSRGYNSSHILPPAHDNTSRTKEGDSTSLPWEAKKRYDDIAKLLLAKDGINVNIRDNYGQSVLLWAAKNGYDASIDLLVKSDGIDINAKDDLHNSALSLAVAKGHTAVVKLLLSHTNLDVVNEDGNGHTTLWLAVETGNETVVELLLEGSTKHRGSISNELLKKAVSENKVRIFALLMAQEGVDLNEKDIYGHTLLSWAVGTKHEEAVKLLLDRTDIDVNAKDTRDVTPLWRAVDDNNISILKLLLNEENVDINARDYLGVSPLLLAVWNHQPHALDSHGWRNRSPDAHHENTKGHRSWSPPSSTVYSSLGIVDMEDGDSQFNVKNHIYDTRMPSPLVSYGSRRPSSESGIRYFDTYTNKHGDYPDETVSPIERDNFKDIIELLLAREDVDINAEDREGNTPLSIAVWNEDAEIVKLLLCKRGIDINKKGSNGYTLIMHGILKNNMTIIRLLLDSTQVNVDSEGPTGWTLVWHAIHKAKWELLHLLIGHGAQVNSRDRSGKPLLAWVAENDEGKAASILLAVNGIDVNCRDCNNRTPLFYAAENGHKPIVEKLLESHDIDINAQDRLEQAPKARVDASAQVDEEQGKLLLKAQNEDNKAKLRLANRSGTNAYNMGGQTALSVAARRRHDGVIEHLLASENVDVNLRDDNGRTALWHAASMDFKSTVVLLLAHDDIDVNIKDNSGKTPLLRATELGYTGVVKLLLAADGIDFMAKDCDGSNPLETAVSNNDEAVVKLILAKGIRDINAKDSKGRTILFFAAEVGIPEIFKLFLSRDDIDINSQDNNRNTPLTTAAYFGNLPIVRLLLGQNNIDVNSENVYNQTALYSASERGHFEIVQLLLSKTNANINSAGFDGRTPLHSAILMGHINVIKLLLSQENIDVNSKTENGWTPLHAAAQNGNLQVVQLLLGYKSTEINGKTQKGSTPLHIASLNGHKPVIQLLLNQQDIELDSRDSEGYTPLNLATDGGRFRITRLLLESGADIEAKTHAGQTPLHIASNSGRFKIVRLLLEHGADRKIADNDGRTAMDLALRNGHSVVAGLLSQ